MLDNLSNIDLEKAKTLWLFQPNNPPQPGRNKNPQRQVTGGSLKIATFYFCGLRN